MLRFGSSDYRDSSVALLLDVWRRFKAVMDVLDAMIRFGVSLSWSLKFTAQWDRILAAGPLYPVMLLLVILMRSGAWGSVISSCCF